MPSWTKMQQAAIDQRNADILVSAAAGSGKTAVLTERVMQRLVGNGQEAPIEIERFLIVTFTSAAAQEMKERIIEKISSYMETLSPALADYEAKMDYLERQMALVPQASISTIHAFCLKTIKAYFNRLDIDPNIKVGNDGELAMLRSELLEELIESYLEAEDKDFLELAEVYGSVKDLEGLKALILDVATFAKSTPFPSIWLKEQVEKLVRPYDAIDDMPWAVELKNQLISNLSGIFAIYKKAQNLCEMPNGPELYGEAVKSDLEAIKGITEDLSLSEMIDRLLGINFVALSRKKQECDPVLKEQVKAYRDLGKDMIKDLQEDLSYVAEEKLLRQLPYVGHLMTTLVRVIEDFEAVYSEKKQEIGVVDYNDLEHYALQLLIEPQLDQTGHLLGVSYTDVAKELSQFYKEVYIDEYQDSNTVQETLLKAVAEAADEEGPTRFMVGDMKQSIYRFRLANPLIFAEKYEAWEKHQGDEASHAQEVCIDLSQNFRSRDNILQGTNDLFEQVMSQEVGELVYDDYAKLYVGNHYTEGSPEDVQEGGLSDAIELHILESSDVDDDGEVEAENGLENLKGVALEAMMVANLIDQLLKGEGNPTHVFDKDLKAYRPIEPKDIVILLRATKGKAELFENALISKGIGAYADMSGNFFDALEIQTMVSLLKLIDNPLQDIPLITVLRSPIVGLTLDELVYIRKSQEEGCFYEALLYYLETLEANSPLKQFMQQLEGYREESGELRLEELIAKLYVETGYYRYVATLPTGAKKRANLDLLKQYAQSYETNNHGKLFGFLRYLDKLSETSEGLKEAKLVGDNENLVRIMSIHKSKGLEFGVVFLCDTGKRFNNSDLRKDVLLHHELGLAPDFVDTKEYVKYPSLPKLAIKEQIKAENMSEEMRVLYVALTRAKEKLFITGRMSHVTNQAKRWQLFANREEKAIMPLAMKKNSSYLNWIGLSLYAHSEVDFFRNLVEDYEVKCFEGKSKWQVKIWHKEDLGTLEEAKKNNYEKQRDAINHWDSSIAYSDYKEAIEERLNYQYPYEQAVLMPTKVSVSEIKRQSMPVTEEVYEVNLYETPQEQGYVPRFIKGEELLQGARRGTLIHSVFEHLDYLKYQTEEEIETEINRLVTERKLEQEVLDVIQFKKLAQMAQSEIVEKMRNAQYVEKEKAFIYLAKASLVDPSYPEEEEILVQGVIDNFFVDDEGITIIDYKTDYVDCQNIEQSKQKIKARYEKQLALYARALEDITKISVAHQYIYLYNINEWMQL